MNPILITALVLRLAPAPAPKPADPWFGLDKMKHFAACMVIESVGYGIANAHNGHTASLRIGGGAVLTIGIAREISDHYRKGLFSKRDLVWDVIGGTAAAIALHQVR